MQKEHKSWVNFVCSCGFEGFILGTDNKENYFSAGYTVCRRCGKKIYIASCPNCRYGQAIAEKKLAEQKGRIKCFICEEFFPLSKQSASYLYSEIFTYNELPQEIKSKIPKITVFHFIIGYMIAMLISLVVITAAGNKYFDNKSIIGIIVFSGAVMYFVYLRVVKKKD